MVVQHRIIHINTQAPKKPSAGEACNGCGVCCLLEPCPLGVVMTRQSRGACRLLFWEQVSQQYRCGAMSEPEKVLQQWIPAVMRSMTPSLLWMLRRWAGRWIAAGHGCDCDVETAAAEKHDQ